MEAAGVLSCTFGLGYILQSTLTGVSTLIDSANTKPFFVPRRRLVLLSFFLTLALSTAFQFASFLLLTKTACQITTSFSTIFGEAARTAATALGLWSSWSTPLSAMAVPTIWILIALRAALGIVVVVFTRTRFMPVCFAVSSIKEMHHSPGIVAAVFDALVFLTALQRAWTVYSGLERGSRERRKGVGQVFVVMGFLVWTVATIPFRIDAGRSIFVRLFPILATLALLLAFLRVFPDAVFTVTQNMTVENHAPPTTSRTGGLQRLPSGGSGNTVGSRGIGYTARDVEATKPAPTYQITSVPESTHHGHTRTNSAVYRNIIGAPIIHPGTAVNWSPENGGQLRNTPSIRGRGFSASSVDRPSSIVETTYPAHAGGNSYISGPLVRNGGFGPSTDSESNASARRQSMIGSAQTTPRTIASFAAVGGMTSSRSTSNIRQKPGFVPLRVSAVNSRRGLGIEESVPETEGVLSPAAPQDGEEYRYSGNTTSTEDDDAARYPSRYSNGGFQLGPPPRLPLGARREAEGTSSDQKVLLINDIVYDNPALVQSLVAQKPKDSGHTTARFSRSASGVLRRSPSTAGRGGRRLSPPKEVDESPVIPTTTPLPTSPTSPVMSRKRSLQARESSRALFPRELRGELKELQRQIRANSISEAHLPFSSPPPPPRAPLPAPPIPKVECPKTDSTVELIPFTAISAGSLGSTEEPMEIFFISKDSPEPVPSRRASQPPEKTVSLAPPIVDKSKRRSSMISPISSIPVTPSEAEDAYETAKAWIASVSTVQRTQAAPVLVDVKRQSGSNHARHDSNPLTIVGRNSQNTRSIFIESTTMRRESSYTPSSAAGSSTSNYAESMATRKSVLSFLASPVIEEEESEGSVIEDDDEPVENKALRSYLDEQSPVPLADDVPGSIDDNSYSGDDESSDGPLSSSSDRDDAVIISDIEDAMVYDRIALTERKLDEKIRELTEAGTFGQQHFKLGDQVPTFYASRFEQYGSKRKPPPPPLGLQQRSSRQSKRLPQVDEVQQGLQRRLTTLTKNQTQEPLEDLMQRLPAAASRRSMRPASILSDGRNSLLARLESEVGQQESQWQGMSRQVNRDSMASAYSSLSSPDTLESAAGRIQRRLSQRRSYLARLSVGVERRLSIAQTTGSSATLTTATTTVSAGGWQRQMAEAQEAYLKQAPELMQKAKGYPVYPEPAVETRDGLVLSPEPESVEYIEEDDISPLKNIAMVIPRLWQAPEKRMEPEPFVSLWFGNRPVVSQEPAALSTRPRKSFNANPLAIESTRLWTKARVLPPAKAPMLWHNPKEFRPKSIIQWGHKRSQSKRVTFVEEVVTVEPTGLFGRLKKLWGKPEIMTVKRQVEVIDHVVPAESKTAPAPAPAPAPTPAPVAKILDGIAKEYEKKALPPLPVSARSSVIALPEPRAAKLWTKNHGKKQMLHDTGLWPTAPALPVAALETIRSTSQSSTLAPLAGLSSTELWKPRSAAVGLWSPRSCVVSSGLWPDGTLKSQNGFQTLWHSREKRPEPRTNLTLNLTKNQERRTLKRFVDGDVKTPVTGSLWSNRSSAEFYFTIDPATSTSSTFSESEVAVIESAQTVMLWSGAAAAVTNTRTGEKSASSGRWMREARAIPGLTEATDPKREADGVAQTSPTALPGLKPCTPCEAEAASLAAVAAAPLLSSSSSSPLASSLWTRVPEESQREESRGLWTNSSPWRAQASTQPVSLSRSPAPRTARIDRAATTPASLPTMTGGLWQRPARTSVPPTRTPTPQLWQKRPLTKKGLWTADDGTPRTPALSVQQLTPEREPRACLWNRKPKAAAVEVSLFDKLPTATLRSRNKLSVTALPLASDELWTLNTAEIPPKKKKKKGLLWGNTSLPPPRPSIPVMWKKDAENAPVLFADLPTDTLRSKKDTSTVVLPVFTEDLWKKQTARPKMWRTATEPTGVWDAEGRTPTLNAIDSTRQKHLWSQTTASRTTMAVPERTKTTFKPNNEPIQPASGSLWTKPAPVRQNSLWKRPVKTVSSGPVPAAVPLWASHKASRTTTKKPSRPDFVPKKSYSTSALVKATGSLWKPQSASQKGLWKPAPKTVAVGELELSLSKTLLWNKNLASRTTDALPVRTHAPKVIRDEPLEIVSGWLWTGPVEIIEKKSLWTPAPPTAPSKPIAAPLWHKSLASRTTSATPSRGTPAPRKPSSKALTAAEGELWKMLPPLAIPVLPSTPQLWRTTRIASTMSSSNSSGASSPALSAVSTLSDMSEIRSPPPPTDSFNIDMAVRHRRQSSVSSVNSLLWQTPQLPAAKAPPMPSAEKLWSAENPATITLPPAAAGESRLRISVPPKPAASLPVFDKSQHKLWATAPEEEEEKEETSSRPSVNRPLPSPSNVVVGQFRRDNYAPGSNKGIELDENSPFRGLLRVKSLRKHLRPVSDVPEVPKLP